MRIRKKDLQEQLLITSDRIIEQLQAIENGEPLPWFTEELRVELEGLLKKLRGWSNGDHVPKED